MIVQFLHLPLNVRSPPNWTDYFLPRKFTRPRIDWFKVPSHSQSPDATMQQFTPRPAPAVPPVSPPIPPALPRPPDPSGPPADTNTGYCPGHPPSCAEPHESRPPWHPPHIVAPPDAPPPIHRPVPNPPPGAIHHSKH